MALESATYISDLNVANPQATDPKSQGDDHLRLLKSTIKATFPNVTGAVTPTHTELNYVAGVTSAVQTQINTKGAIAGQAWTGTHTFVTQSAGDNSTKAATTAYVDTGLALKGNLAGATWTGTQSFTGATITVPTQAASDNTTKAASTAFVQQVAFSAALPNQSGNANKALFTDGSAASWRGAFTGDSGAGGAVGVVPAPAAGDASKFLKGDGTWALAPSAPDTIVQDQKTSGTSSSVYASSAWRDRDMNTVVRNNGSVGSLASNVLTLPAGTWLLRGRAAIAYQIGSGATGTVRARARIYNSTDASVASQGENVIYSSDITTGGGVSEVVAVVTIASSKGFKLQVYHSSGSIQVAALSSGEAEIYATLEATRISL